MMEEKVPILAAFGNPLLDISVHLPDNEILRKHNLDPNGSKEISHVDLKTILKDIDRRSNKKNYGPGGAAQNTARILQWILKDSYSIVYIGSIGNDEYGQKLATLVKNDGVDTRYVICEKMTGICIALVNGPHRSLAACLGAALDFSSDDLRNNTEILEVLHRTQYIYVEGFFVVERQEVVNDIVQFCKQYNKTFIFNLSGSYLFESSSCSEVVKKLALECDILFGNRPEFEALISSLNIGRASVENALVHLNKVYGTRKDNKPPKVQNKVVVCTDGASPVICVSGDRNIVSYPVPRIPEEEIVDTTGAGDAFVAGFMAGVIKQQDVKTNIEWGCLVSQRIIKETGCNYPRMDSADLLLQSRNNSLSF